MRPLHLILALCLLASLSSGCGPAADTSNKPRVALVLSVGGLGDKSFNDSAHEGLMRARSELPVRVFEGQPTMLAEDERYLRTYASRGFDLVIGVGFLMKSAVLSVAKDFPKTKFALIDAGLDDGENPGNVATLLFREEEGSFLVGAAAAITSQTGVVGFVGGMDIPLIRKFQAGYEQGAHHVRPDCKVLVEYAGSGPEAFSDPVRGKQLAEGMISQRADVLFHAAGSTGNGVIEAARAQGKLAIGVDANQDGQAPGFVLTSMIKRVDIAVFEIVKEHLDGKFSATPHHFGLDRDAVGTTDFHYMRDAKLAGPRMPRGRLDEVLKKLDELKVALMAKKIQVKL